MPRVLFFLALVLLEVFGCRREARTPQAPERVEELVVTPITYGVQITSHPQRPIAMAKTSLSLRVLASSGPEPHLEQIESTPIHLIVVSRDLGWYEHLHPRKEGHVYTAAAIFPADGEYILHTIIQPVGVPRLVRQQTLVVGTREPSKPASSLTVSPVEQRSGSYAIRLRTRPEPPATDGWNSLIFDISRKGEPVTNLTPTGTLGHMVILREGGEDFVYAHSTDGEAVSGVRALAHQPAVPPSVDNTHRRHVGDTGPTVTFHTQFPRAGKYKMWVEFRAGVDSLGADFVVEVVKGDPANVQHRD